jgi:hypothetical protein
MVDAVGKPQSADAETRDVKNPGRANIVFSGEPGDVSILRFPGYILISR